MKVRLSEGRDGVRSYPAISNPNRALHGKRCSEPRLSFNSHSFPAVPGRNRQIVFAGFSSARVSAPYLGLTSHAPRRSVKVVMKNVALGNRRLPTVCSALITILALLAVPFCGPACASAIGCEKVAATGLSAETCHHAAVSTPAESETSASTSARSCNRHELPAILSASEDFSTLNKAPVSASPFSVIAPTHFFISLVPAAHDTRWVDDDVPLSGPSRAASTSVLRI
jgi:hypothetical protein